MSADEFIALLDRPVEGAALGAALELGLIPTLEAEPADTASVGRGLGICPGRCEAWLRVLEAIGVVEELGSRWRPTQAARASILGGYTAGTWALLAQEARERLAAVVDLPGALRAAPGEKWVGTAGYVEQMAADPERARRFTRMLYEIHQPLAADVAAALDLGGTRRLMDLGGGSGVVAIALAKRWPKLEVTIVDIATVCAAGREIAAAEGVDDRILFQGADFLRDPLPGGFDAVLECDVAVFSEALFRKSVKRYGRAAGSSSSTNCYRMRPRRIGRAVPGHSCGPSQIRPGGLRPSAGSRSFSAAPGSARSGGPTCRPGPAWVGGRPVR